MKMSGREVFKYAVGCMLRASRQALQQCGMTIDDIDCIIPHQANRRIIEAVGTRLGAPISKYYMNMDRCGNMSAASVAVALDEAVRKGFIKDKHMVLLMSFGGGFTWGATILEWSGNGH